jgi:23S rRNA (uracil1939-C5)-methyltransferase
MVSDAPVPNAKQKTTVEVEKLVYGGDALARLSGHVVLMPFALPGEQVQIEPRRAKGDLLRARSVEVLQPSLRRVQPKCEYFGRCGGCQYQHAEYAYQLEQKSCILRETLLRIGGISFEADIRTISGEPWQYRNRIQLHFETGRMGFRYADSHEICGITHCPISSPKLNEVIGILAKAVTRPEWPAFLRSLEIFTDEKAVQLHVVETNRPVAARFFEWMTELIPGCVPGALDYDTGKRAYRVSRGSFFQVNRFLIEPLVEEGLTDVSGQTALDLYAGVGLFTIPMADRFQHVEGVERGGAACRDLEWNIAGLGERVSIAKADASEYLKRTTVAPDFIVADPPRAGIGREVAGELLRIRSPRVTVVSCDPATLSRDLKILQERYVIERMTVVDLFPQTFHFETVAHLGLKR